MMARDIFDENSYAMSRIMLMCVLVMFILPAVHAQERNVIEDIMHFLGVDSPQDLDEYEMERLSEFHSAPVKLNRTSESVLRATGLFSQYQLAVLSDYKARHGAVMSLAELAELDGFGQDFVSKLAPFIFIDQEGALDGQQSSFRNDLHLRTGYKMNADGHHGSYAVKYRLQSDGRCQFSLSCSRPYDIKMWYPSIYSASFLWRFRGERGSIVFGDFNARFGQGLALWNNIFVTALTSPDSFMKKPSGISPVWSYTGSSSLTGIAADVRAGPWSVCVMAAFPGLKAAFTTHEKLNFMPAVNVSWYGRSGHAAITNVATFPAMASSTDIDVRTSLDCAFCISGINVFGEMVYGWNDSMLSAVAGSRFRTGERHDMAVLLKHFHNEQTMLAASGTWMTGERKHTCNWSVETSYYPISKDIDDSCSAQFKSVLAWNMTFSRSFQMKVRLNERVRTWGRPFRTDVRTDLSYDHGEFAANLRFNVVSCSRVACLAYVEEEYERDRISFHLRQGVFCVDEWDDRIYVYEHDVPGSFNAPAMYGRGVWTSAVVRTRLTQDMRLYLRASYTGYPFMSGENKKPGKAELKFQMQYRF